MSSRIRPTQHDLHLENSRLNVWLYDEANLVRLAALGASDAGYEGTPGDLTAKLRTGLLVGYTLQCAGDAAIAVIVGPPLTPAELAAALWHAPQTAWLRLSSGALNVETDDLSRLGRVCSRTRGDAVQLPAGDYRVTLHRVDYEALDDRGEVWRGPSEYLVLSPGGTEADVVGGMLEFRRSRVQGSERGGESKPHAAALALLCAVVLFVGCGTDRETTPDGDAGGSSDVTVSECTSRTFDVCEADARCLVIEGYPVTEESDGALCADMLGAHIPIGCVPANGVWPTMLTCMRNTATGEVRVTNNKYDALLAQGWEYCDQSVPPCSS